MTREMREKEGWMMYILSRALQVGWDSTIEVPAVTTQVPQLFLVTTGTFTVPINLQITVLYRVLQAGCL